MVTYRPRVILSAAVSIDGKIATRRGDSALSSKKDKIRLHKVRSKVDAILVGRNTVRVDDPLLTVRYVRGKNPTRVVLDSRARISTKSQIIKTAKNIPTIIAVSAKAPKKNLQRLEEHSAKIIIAGRSNIDLKRLLALLKKENIKTVLAEGGGTLNWEFVRQGLVDELIVTITPRLVGGRDAVTLVEGVGFAKIADSLKLNLRKITKQGDEVVLHYI
ncbi:MAG: 2,5-diamino-6-(ribosylamino)-4(3H)-pyrimidinone 5'-phosphate reductase [Candidatus Nitrosotenuis sp.]|nr:2,5-diamino-6-(ribosylamino)-4(3H)-pyrimidinone 5'-phosphate reductase [Candidatus Nitrosotenuis sp.]